MYIIFNDSLDTKYNIRGFSQEGNLLTIQTKKDVEIPDNNSGFKIYDPFDDSLLGDLSNFTTKYNVTDIGDAIIFSNDSSVEDENNPLIIRYEEIPSTLILAASLESLKTSKIKESKTLLEVYLANNPLVSNCHGGVEASYTVTSEKQALMSSNYLTYTIAKASGVENPVLTWNATGCEGEEGTEIEYVTLIMQISAYVKPLISRQQAYEVQIKACTTREELDAIVIDYSTLTM